MTRLIALLLTACLSWQAQAHCYIVHGPDDQVLYRSLQTPVDLSRPLAEQVRAIWPGSHMVIGPVSRLCTEFDQRKLDAERAASRAAQLQAANPTTDQRSSRPVGQRRSRS